MNCYLFKVWLLFLCLIFPLSSFSLEFMGNLEQGGFIVGKTVPNANVSLEDVSVTADNDGVFVVGLNRNLEGKVILKITLLEGVEENHILKIKEKKYTTQSITGVKRKYVTPPEEELLRIKNDKKKINNARLIYQSLPYIFNDFIKPVDNFKISGVYGSRRVFNGEERSWHKGVDFAAPEGTVIKAPSGGVVRLVLLDSFYNGNLIILDHGYQLMTIYAHLSEVMVKEGDVVSQGEVIGKVGSTGRSTGPHLHWGLYWRNMALDPMLLLTKKTGNK